MIDVYLNKCDKYEKSVEKLIKMLEPYKDKFEKGDKVLLKPNLLSPKEVEKAVTTHPKIVEAVILFLLDLDVDITLGDSPATGTALQAVKANGIYDVCEKYHVPVVELDEPVEVDGENFKKIKISKKVLDADKIINIAKLKTHSQMILTMAIKNIFGCVVGKEKSAWHFRAKTNINFAKVIVDIHNIVKPTINIVDGIEGMEGNGPANGKQKHFGVIGVSENAYALDHALAQKLNVKEKYVYILKESMKQKLIPEYKIKGDWEGEDIKLPITAPIFETVTNISRALQRVPEINVEKCISCRICEESCPADAITIDDHSIDYDKCIRCYVCHEVCPEDAIDLKRKIFK
ncbi:MAG: DUF362 domain-containing protein [Thermotogota bacterium]